MQTEPVTQRTPQPPQFAESLRTSVHCDVKKPQQRPTLLFCINRHAVLRGPPLHPVATHWRLTQKVPG